MVNLRIDQSNQWFERSDANLPEERCQDAPIVLAPSRPLEPGLRLAEDRNTGSHAMARLAQPEYTLADARFIVDDGTEVVGIEEVSDRQRDSISRRTSSLA